MTIDEMEVGNLAKIDRTTRFPIIQSLRGFAALWVVLFHAAEGKQIDRLMAVLPEFLDDAIFRAGHFGVAVFFALSGFVIAHSLRDLPLSGRTYCRFVLRRAVRLDPPYWMAIALAVAFAYGSAVVKQEPNVFPSVTNVVAHVAYIQVILDMPVINTAFWTLTYEFQFYLFLAAMLTLAANGRAGWAREAAWGFMYLLALVSAAGGLWWVRQGVFLDLWPAFFIGTLCYRAVDDRLARVALVPLVLVIAAIHSPTMLVSAATALFLLAATIAGIAQRKSRFRFAQYLGTISYSLYLIHNPLIGATGFVVRRALGTSLAADLVALAAIILVCIAGATVFWWVIERPSLRLTHAISLRAPRAEFAAARYPADPAKAFEG